MADTTTSIIAVVLVFVMIAVTWLELRYMRRRSKSRKLRSTSRPDDLQDEAHNALVTTRAIASTMAERGGVQSDEVKSLLREAQMAYSRRNYRVTLDLTKRAKDRLVSLRGQQASLGDLTQLDAVPSDAASDEPTTKELLQKEYPPNLVQSKFAISVAEASIESGAGSGREVVQARTLLVSAKSRFDAQDYSGALSVARQAEKSARGEAVAASVPSPSSPPSHGAPSVPADAPRPSPAAVPVGSVCPSCGTPMKADDAFCRKCGTRVVLTNCPNCGASLLVNDAFCRKCGARIQR